MPGWVIAAVVLWAVIAAVLLPYAVGAPAEPDWHAQADADLRAREGRQP